MKDIIKLIKFCESNNCNYKIETLRNGVRRATIKTESHLSVREIRDKAREKFGDGYYVDTDFEAKVFIYNREGWRKVIKERFRLVTVEEMQSVTSKLIELGFGEYSVLCRVPFNAGALMYPSWDAYAFESSAIDSNAIYLDLAEYSNQVMLPDRLLELAEKLEPNQNGHGRGSNSVETFDKVLLDLINKGFAEHYIWRPSFNDDDDKYETFALGQVFHLGSESVYFSLEKV